MVSKTQLCDAELGKYRGFAFMFAYCFLSSPGRSDSPPKKSNGINKNIRSCRDLSWGLHGLPLCPMAAINIAALCCPDGRYRRTGMRLIQL